MRADDVAVRVDVGLRVDLRRLAEGGPAQLGDAARTGHFGEIVFCSHILHAARILAEVDFAPADGRRANGIVASIGESLGRFDQDRTKGLFFLGDNAKDTAHRIRIPSRIFIEARFLLYIFYSSYL